MNRFNLDTLRQRLRPMGEARPIGTPATEVHAHSVADNLAAILGGEWCEGCHVISYRYKADYWHGAYSLAELHRHSGASFRLLCRDSGLAEVDFRRTLFLDTETNGLAGGAGTYAFLVGVGYWEGDEFVVQQFFMRHPADERALLGRLAELLDGYDSFVTFNGKSFDLPLLETRYILARQQRALRTRPHLDLLHPARRLWKGRLESCALGQLEARILGLTRSEADVPGYLIPHLYNTFLRDQNAHPLKGIFYHNHQDLLALAALAVHMAQILGAPEQFTAPYGHDHFALACLHDDQGMAVEAEAGYRRTLQFPIPASLRKECLRRLALLCKRQGRHEAAAELWRTLLPDHLIAYEELAKYHEHIRRDYEAAERAVCAALAAVEARQLFISKAEREGLAYRLARIQRKLALASQPTSTHNTPSRHSVG